MKISGPLVVYLPDTRGVEISRFGKGNLKIGMGVFTYSRLSGLDATCPGASEWCQMNCYARRVSEPILSVWAANSSREDAPEIPGECRLLRLHVGGDYTSAEYVDAWQKRLQIRPDVLCWSYTRSWRIPAMLPALERLRALPNVQLFASTDESTPEQPPKGWRIAWIQGDQRAIGYVCPEETGRKQDCESCRYCFKGKRGDVMFLRH